MHGFVAGFFACRSGKRIRLIYHNHDLVELKKTKGFSRWIKRFELLFVRYADKVVFPELNRAKIFQKDAKLASLPEIVINAPLRHITLPSPSNRLLDVLKEKDAPPESKIVLFHGSIGKSHCIFEVVKSMNIWPIDSCFVLLGYCNSDYKEKILQSAKNNRVADRVIFLSPVPYSKISAYICAVHVGLGLIQPININFKHYPGASNKLFQYMAAGIPFVTNDNPEFRNLFASFGTFFADPNSPESIGKAVSMALQNKNRPNEPARQAHLTRYNYETQFQPVLEYIKKKISE